MSFINSDVQPLDPMNNVQYNPRLTYNSGEGRMSGNLMDASMNSGASNKSISYFLQEAPRPFIKNSNLETSD